MQRRLSVLVCLIALVIGSPKSHATGFNVFDNPNLLTDIKSTVNEIKQGIQNNEYYIQAVELSTRLYEQLNSGMNNGAANFIARISSAKQEIQNLGILEVMEPIANACGTVSMSFSLNNMGCQVDSVASPSSSNPSYSAYVKGDDKQRKKNAKSFLNKIESTHPQLFKDPGSDPNENEGNDSSPNSYALNAAPLFSGSSMFLSLGSEDYEAMDSLINLVVPEPSMRPQIPNVNQLDDEGMLAFLSMESGYNLPYQSLKKTLALRTSGSVLAENQGAQSSNEISVLYGLEKQISERVSSDSLLLLSQGETSTPTKLYRTRVLNIVSSIDVLFKQLDSGLRVEAIVARRLSGLVNRQ